MTPLASRSRQLYDALRGAILSGELRPGGRLPATRTLAAELGVSRTTVVTAYQQLLAEGYLLGQVGSGTYVCTTLPEESLTAPRPPEGIPGNSPPATGAGSCWSDSPPSSGRRRRRTRFGGGASGRSGSFRTWTCTR